MNPGYIGSFFRENHTFLERRKQAPGNKSEKQHITFLTCAKATAKHKIKLLVIGKTNNPKVF